MNNDYRYEYGYKYSSDYDIPDVPGEPNIDRLIAELYEEYIKEQKDEQK